MITEIPFHQVPRGVMTKFNPRWRNASASEIEADLAIPKNWTPYGFTRFLFCRNTASVYMLKGLEAGADKTITL